MIWSGWPPKYRGEFQYIPVQNKLHIFKGFFENILILSPKNNKLSTHMIGTHIGYLISCAFVVPVYAKWHQEGEKRYKFQIGKSEFWKQTKFYYKNDQVLHYKSSVYGKREAPCNNVIYN